MKFEPVFVTVAVAEDDDLLRDFTNNVHINALKRNTRRKEDTLANITIWNARKCNFSNWNKVTIIFQWLKPQPCWVIWLLHCTPRFGEKCPCLMFLVRIRPRGWIVVFLVKSTVLMLFIFCDVYEHGLSVMQWKNYGM